MKATMVFVMAGLLLLVSGARGAEDRKAAFVESVVRGGGLMPWQEAGPSEKETRFRERMEARKTAYLADRVPVVHPVLLAEADWQRARANIAAATWAREWYEGHERVADHVVAQPEGYIDAMISLETPWHSAGFTCPNCVGIETRPVMGRTIVEWDYRDPDVISCAACGHEYPSGDYPETAVLRMPRRGQVLTFYLNPAQQANPDDRSGELAWQWVGYPKHVNFTGLVRYEKARFLIQAAESLAIVYRMTGEARYAQAAAAIVQRTAEAYPHWLYHDYFDTIADCDPLYAAWHDKDLELEWKRHLSSSVYEEDTADRAAMLQTYFGAGRFFPGTGGIFFFKSLLLAYDLTWDAKDSAGHLLWTPESREKVERDLFLEAVFEAEPWLNENGETSSMTNNKSPRLYETMGTVGRVLGIPWYVHASLLGYENLRDEAFLYDGFSRESPGYSNFYMAQLVGIPELLQGFQWPAGFTEREGTLDFYGNDEKLRLMYRAVIDCKRPDACHLPLEDTNIDGLAQQRIVEIGALRYPDLYRNREAALLKGRAPGEFSVFHRDPGEALGQQPFDPAETYFPAWMTGILRHGVGNNGTVLSLNFSPGGAHRQPDTLSLYYYDSGLPVLGDRGNVGAGDTGGWILKTGSHNLVVVDDGVQENFWDRGVKLEMMLSGPRVSAVEASAGNVYPQCGDYRRRIVLLKGPEARTIAVDLFTVRGGNKHAYRLSSEMAASDAPNGRLTFSGVELPPEPPLPEDWASASEKELAGLRDVRLDTEPEPRWQAVWSEEQHRFRLWMQAEVDSVQASNGPGMIDETNPGRRVRYVDGVREGENLESLFVAVHEPAVNGADFVVRDATRLPLPEEAGADAVALRLDTDWGRYWLFHHCEAPVEVDGIRFQGSLGVFCEPALGDDWLVSSGAATLRKGAFGFEGRTAVWTGEIASHTAEEIRTTTPRPGDWADSEEWAGYVLVHDGSNNTGFPVKKTGENRMVTDYYPLPEVTGFTLPAVVAMEK